MGTKLKREQKGAVNINPILIVILVGIVTVVGIAWYLKIGPFKQGNVGISLGYTLEDGTEVELTGNALNLFYSLDNPLRWYTDSNLTTRIVAIWGQLYVNATTDLSVSTIDIQYSRYVVDIPNRGNPAASYPGSNVSGMTATIPPNANTRIVDSKFTVTLPVWTSPTTEKFYGWVWHYDVTATATDPSVGTKTATSSVDGDMTAYWKNDGTMTITASFTSGSLQFI